MLGIQRQVESNDKCLGAKLFNDNPNYVTKQEILQILIQHAMSLKNTKKDKKTGSQSSSGLREIDNESNEKSVSSNTDLKKVSYN